MFATHLRSQAQHLHARQPQLLGRFLDILFPEPLRQAGHEIRQALLRFGDTADKFCYDRDSSFSASLHGI